MARKRANKGQAEGQGTDTPQDADKISKADAVRAAVTEGVDSPEKGVQFIKERYGLGVSRQQFSSYKSQDKARQRKSGAGRSRPDAGSPGRPHLPLDASRQRRK